MAFMAYQETSYPPKFRYGILSLGGQAATGGRPRSIRSNSYTLGTGADGQNCLVLPANLKRISAIIQNYDDAAAPGAQILIKIGNVNSIPLILLPYGILQIDTELPWIGDIYASAANGALFPVLLVNEIEVT